MATLWSLSLLFPKNDHLRFWGSMSLCAFFFWKEHGRSRACGDKKMKKRKLTEKRSNTGSRESERELQSLCDHTLQMLSCFWPFISELFNQKTHTLLKKVFLLESVHYLGSSKRVLLFCGKKSTQSLVGSS